MRQEKRSGKVMVVGMCIAAAGIIAALIPGSLSTMRQAVSEEQTPDTDPASTASLYSPLGEAMVGAASPDGANTVHVGLYLLRLPSLNIKENNFRADFYLWFRWNGARWRDSENTPAEGFELPDGVFTVKEKTGETENIGNGWLYECYRVQAVFSKFWNTTKYPFDTHEIRIEIEDQDMDERQLRYIVDLENTKINPDFSLMGWNIGPWKSYIESHDYKTNWGAGQDQIFPYSRFVFSIRLERSSRFLILIKLYGLFLPVLIALATFWISPVNVDIRFGLCIGAIFAVIANHIVISGNLPENGQITLMDMLHLIGVVTIFAAIILSMIALRICEKNRFRQDDFDPNASHLFDIVCFSVLLSLYAVQNMVIILLYSRSG